MISTSAEYKTIIASGRQKWTVSAQIDYSDFGIDNSITAGQIGADRLSRPEQMADGIESPTYKWWSWANFEWGQHVRNEDKTSSKESGALSQRISFPDKTFPLYSGAFAGHGCATSSDKISAPSPYQYYPTFYISFSPRTVSTIKAVFDDKLNEWAEDFDIEIIDSSGVVQSTTNVTGHTSIRYDKDITDVLNASIIKLTVKSWNYAGSKAKVMEMFTSYSETYESQDIESLSIHEEALPKDATQPIGNISANSCSLKLININDKFDNDNSASPLAGNVGKNKRISLFAKLWLPTAGIYESITLGVFYSTKWNVQSRKMETLVLGQDIISIMGEQNYTKSQFITAPSNQNFTYTSTSDFNGFTLNNIEVTTNEMQLGDEAGASFTLDKYSHAGYTIPYGKNVNSDAFSSWTTYQGSAIKQVTFTYTPGTTVKLAFVNELSIPLASSLQWFISYKTIDDYVEFDPSDGYVFTPEDITNTSQTFKLKVVFNSASSTIKPIVKEIAITVSQYTSLYSLAAKIIEEFDDQTDLIAGNYSIDQSYGDYIIPSAFLKPDTYQNLLKTISEAAIGRVYTNRTGSLKMIGPDSIETPLKDYTDSNSFEIASPSNPNVLANKVIVKVNELVQDTSEEVASVQIELEDGETKTYTIFFKEEPVDTITYGSLPGSVTRDSEVEYTWGTVVTFTNSSGSDQDFNFTVDGRVYRLRGNTQVTASDTESIRRNGTVVYKIDNPLIQTEEHATAVATLMLNSFSSEKRFMAVDGLPDPSLEIGDTVCKRSQNNYVVQTQDFSLSKGTPVHLIEASR